jgi:phosphoribosyl 1,2-cyclic phosphodiesterase
VTVETLASGSGGNAYIVSDGRTPLLMECGLPIGELRKGAGFELSGMAAVLVSHRHNDHCRSLGDCLRSGLDVYAPREAFEAKGASGRRCRPTEPFVSFAAGTFRVWPFDCVHDCECHGYLLHSAHSGERLIYFTDTSEVKYRFDGLTHIMAECNYSGAIADRNAAAGVIPAAARERLESTHMSLGRLLEYFRANDLSRVREIWLMHLSANNSDAAAFREAVAGETGIETRVCL